MGYFIGIDGGASKTRFALIDEKGRAVAERASSGTSYIELGIDAVSITLIRGIDELCRDIGRENVRGVCFGMPCYGEQQGADAEAAREIERALAPMPVYIINDVAAAWAGALALKSGIIVLAGTGSMAWGRDRSGIMKRCGGLPNFFSDEGSGYWLGRRTLEVFSKQSDGRLPRGELYEIVRERFALSADIDIVVKLDEMGYTRKNIAALQLLLMEAALKGDESALSLYEEAALELALLAKGLRATIDLEPGSPLSYAGGLWGAGELIMRPFREAVSSLDLVFTEPALSPVFGAVLLAAEHFEPDGLEEVKKGLSEYGYMTAKR